MLEQVTKAVSDMAEKHNNEMAAQKTELAEVKSRLQAAEQEIVSRMGRGNGATVAADPIGDVLATKKDEIQNAVRNKSRAVFDIPLTFGRPTKSIGLLVTDGGGNSPRDLLDLSIQRLGGIGNDPRIDYTLSDSFRSLQVGTENFDFLQLSALYVSGAGYQEGQGAEKPESAPKFDKDSAAVATIAHWMAVSKQAINDYTPLRAYIDDLLRYGLKRKLDIELANGSGAANHIQGITGVANSFSASGSKSERIGRTKNALSKLGFKPDTVLLSVDDIFDIETERATGGDQQYVNPTTQGRYFGLNVIPSIDVTANTAYVYDSSAALLLQRENATVTIGWTGNQFIENTFTILAELRAGLAILSPTAIKKVVLS